MKDLIKNTLKNYEIEDVKEVSGGDVNRAFKLKGDDKDFFMLLQENRQKDFYDAEVKGLRDFEKYGINAPKVYEYGNIGNDAYLLLNYVEMNNFGDQKKLGRLIAKLHKVYNKDKLFGYDYPYHGKAISFDNSFTNSWIEIFVENRLDKLNDRLKKEGLFTNSDTKTYKKAREIIIRELENKDIKPSLLHGDLWAGNFAFDGNDNPIIFDPASLFGDREFDIGITTVFGGFNEDFYKTYFKEYPLADGYELRLEFYRLYLFLVHLLKFGNIYKSSVDNSIDRIINLG